MAKLSSVVLLAGFSTRMGELKQHVKIGSKSFLERIMETLSSLSSYIDEYYFVGQVSDIDSINIVKDFGGIWINNPRPENGPLSSIRLAINEMDEYSDFILWPVDHPKIQQKTVAKLVKTWEETTDRIIVPSIRMRRGHPTIFPAHMHKDFFIAPLAKGARVILQKYPEQITHVETDDEWIRKNINTPELLEEARLSE